MKKINSIKKDNDLTRMISWPIFLAMMLIFLFPTKNISAQNNSLILTSHNNIESVNNEGRIYYMELRNNNDFDSEIDLSISNYNKDLNPDKTSSKENVILNAKFLTEEGVELSNHIKLKSKEVLKFQIKVTVPDLTPFEKWNCLLVNAKSKANVESSIQLFTFIPNPTEK
ncbi:MAG: hypothetical protein HXX09_11025 [Bacteroidetes bacterium]|nr:hypothetical protein [Bacteroidota bacterium]